MPVTVTHKNPLKGHPLEGTLREAIAKGDYRYLTGVAQVEERFGKRSVAAFLRREAQQIQKDNL